MIFIFAPALVSLALILAIVLREQFTFRRSVSMLDQIELELAARLRVKEPRRTLGSQRALAVQASRKLVGLLESADCAGPRGMHVKALDH